MVPWVGLLGVLAAAVALETALASLPPATVPPKSYSTRSSSPRGERQPLWITLVDRASGTQMTWRCMSDQPPIDDLIVDANALADVAVALCGP